MSENTITFVVLAAICWPLAGYLAWDWWRFERELKCIQAAHEAEMAAIARHGAAVAGAGQAGEEVAGA